MAFKSAKKIEVFAFEKGQVACDGGRECINCVCVWVCNCKECARLINCVVYSDTWSHSLPV